MVNATHTWQAGAALILALGMSMAVSSGSSGNGGSAPPVKHIKVSGCLQPGDPPNDFTLRTKGGKSYGLSSSAVRLGDYLGHRVAIGGELKPRVSKEDYDFEGSEIQEYSVKQIISASDIEVATLKVISPSCSSPR